MSKLLDVNILRKVIVYVFAKLPTTSVCEKTESLVSIEDRYFQSNSKEIGCAFNSIMNLITVNRKGYEEKETIQKKQAPYVGRGSFVLDKDE